VTPFILDSTVQREPFSGRVLFGRSDRPLFVPYGDDDFVREAIRLFVQSGIRRVLATLMVKVDQWLPRLRLLPQANPMPTPLPEIYSELGIAEENAALYYGSPGPLRKLTIFSSSTGRSVTKIALQPAADMRILNEGKILALLNAHRIGVDSVPALLDHGKLSSGRGFVRTSVLPSGRCESRFGPMHLAFLNQLYEHRVGVTCWVHGKSYQSLLRQFSSIRGSLDPVTCVLLDAVLKDIGALSANEPVAECIVHGDFAPWNISATGTRLFVYDWENAVTRGNPLHDFLHFHLIPAALLRGGLRQSAFKRLIDNARRRLTSLAGQTTHLHLVSALTLHYLAEIVIFFCSADGKLMYSHPVVKSYLHLMRCRHSWLPEASLDGEPTHER
jgi:hypothetical protein